MSRRKISSESFSSLGSDYLETSPEEEGECPLSKLCWNGSRSPPGLQGSRAAAKATTPAPAAAAVAAAAAAAGSKRVQRRRRVNLDSLGESISLLTAPSVSWGQESQSFSRGQGWAKLEQGYRGAPGAPCHLGATRPYPGRPRIPSGPLGDNPLGLGRRGTLGRNKTSFLSRSGCQAPALNSTTLLSFLMVSGLLQATCFALLCFFFFSSSFFLINFPRLCSGRAISPFQHPKGAPAPPLEALALSISHTLLVLVVTFWGISEFHRLFTVSAACLSHI